MDQTAVMYTDDGQTFVKLGGKKKIDIKQKMKKGF